MKRIVLQRLIAGFAIILLVQVIQAGRHSLFSFSVKDAAGSVLPPPEFDHAVTCLILFGDNCSSCNGNILFWDRIARTFGQKISIIGLVPHDFKQLIQLANARPDLRFPVFQPTDMGAFNQTFPFEMGFSHTLIYKNGIIRRHVVGELYGEEYETLCQEIKKALMEKTDD